MRLLIVEDDPDAAAVIALTLTRDHHEVEIAATGDEGLWLATEIDFDLVVLDWGLPGTEGIEVCRQLRVRRRTMPILMLTGNDAASQRATGRAAGADDFLAKPFDPDELVHCVRRLVPAF